MLLEVWFFLSLFLFKFIVFFFFCLISYLGGGEVYEWDLRRRRCRERWTDEGSSTVTAISASRSYLACGSAGLQLLFPSFFFFFP